MLDANVVIGLLAGTSEKLRRRAIVCGEGELVLSSIAFAEVALGSRNGRRPGLPELDRLARAIPVMPFDYPAAQRYAQLPFKRGSHDRLIAAHALALDLTLVTDSEDDFAGLPGLRVENWTR